MNCYEKMKVSLRYYLLGKGYYAAVDALEFAAQYHTGFRKDGVTPEFQHQIEIAHYVRTLQLMHPERTIAATLLHDVREDYNVSDHELLRRFGEEITRACIILDKTGKEPELYHAECASSPITSIAKGGDRIHNIQTMTGVFTPEKQQRYIQEVHDHFFPMIKLAKRTFPQQEAAYENIKHMLTSQIQLLSNVVDK